MTVEHDLEAEVSPSVGLMAAGWEGCDVVCIYQKVTRVLNIPELPADISHPTSTRASSTLLLIFIISNLNYDCLIV